MRFYGTRENAQQRAWRVLNESMLRLQFLIEHGMAKQISEDTLYITDTAIKADYKFSEEFRMYLKAHYVFILSSPNVWEQLLKLQ